MDTLMRRLRTAGVREFDHHYSDLYTPLTDISREVIMRWFRDRDLNPNTFVSSFYDPITEKLWYEVAFAYDPFWNNI